MEVMYALLVNETSPPIYQSNVGIRNEPPNVTSAAPTQPISTGRPLVGPGPANDASGIAANFKTFVALVIALVGAFVTL